jgi:hypothetical protein
VWLVLGLNLAEPSAARLPRETYRVGGDNKWGLGGAQTTLGSEPPLSAVSQDNFTIPPFQPPLAFASSLFFARSALEILAPVQHHFRV